MCKRPYWERVYPGTEEERALKPEQIVQICDYVTSRKCASFLQGVELTEEQIESFTVE